MKRPKRVSFKYLKLVLKNAKVVDEVPRYKLSVNFHMVKQVLRYYLSDSGMCFAFFNAAIPVSSAIV